MSDSLFFEDEFELDNEIPEDEYMTFSGGKYTTKVQAPHYVPNGPCPAISDMIDTSRYEDLIREINASNVSDEDKRFLRLAAARLIVFDFSKVANYYAYADKELQELMEKLALVIIDFNDAIKYGFVRLNKQLDELISQQIEENGEE